MINELESIRWTVVLVVYNDSTPSVITLQDILRADTATAVSELNALGAKGVILTGDSPHAIATIVGELGLEFKVGLLPKDKVEVVTRLNQHASLTMAGDGINDASAMKATAVGIAMGSGTDMALGTADATLTHNHLCGLVQMIGLARATHASIHQNITIALGLRGVFLAITLLGTTGSWLVVLADTGTTVLVTANALRLLRRKQRGYQFTVQQCRMRREHPTWPTQNIEFVDMVGRDSAASDTVYCIARRSLDTLSDLQTGSKQ